MADYRPPAYTSINDDVSSPGHETNASEAVSDDSANAVYKESISVQAPFDTAHDNNLSLVAAAHDASLAASLVATNTNAGPFVAPSLPHVAASTASASTASAPSTISSNFHALRDEAEDRSDLQEDDLTALLPNQELPDASDLFGCSHRLVAPLFFLLAFFVYFDRGVLAVSLDTLQSQLLSDNSLKGGALASAYLFGYCISCPIFSLLGSYYPPIRMSAGGMLVWSLGCGATGVFSGFGWLLCARLLTGIGEASFLSFSSTIIDTIVPDASRAKWLGFFYMAIPLGYAFGYAVGGEIVDAQIYKPDSGNWSDDNQSWRFSFLLECIVMIFLVVGLFCMKSPPNMLVIKEIKDGRSGKKRDAQESDDPFLVKLRRVLFNKTWLAATAGYSTQTFVTGTFAVEATTYLQKVYGESASTAGIMIGAITFVTGVLGSILGGIILDAMIQRMRAQHGLEVDAAPGGMDMDQEDASVEVNVESTELEGRDNESSELTDYVNVAPALNLLTFLNLLAFPAAFVVFLFHNKYLFFALLAFAELMIFASTGPVNNVILWCSLYKDRPLAGALNTLSIHLFGDALAPILIGIIVDAKKSDGASDKDAYNFALEIGSWWLALSVVSFFVGRYTLNSLRQFMVQNQAQQQRKNLTVN